MRAAASYYERAIALFRELDERQGLISALAMSSMRGASYVFETEICPTADPATCDQDAEEAIALARRIGWRAGEAGELIYIGLGMGRLVGHQAQPFLQRAVGRLAVRLQLGTQFSPVHGLTQLAQESYFDQLVTGRLCAQGKRLLITGACLHPLFLQSVEIGDGFKRRRAQRALGDGVDQLQRL